MMIIKVCRVLFSTNKQTNKQITTISIFNKNFTLKQTKKQTNKKSNKQINNILYTHSDKEGFEKYYRTG